MRSHSSSASGVASPSSIRFQQFLVPPFERLRFSILFVVATGIGWLLVALVLKSLQNPTLPPLWQEGEILGTFVSGLVSGLIVGATQWFVLRRYASDWLWIVANTAGYVILMVTLQGWRLMLGRLLLVLLPTQIGILPSQTLLALAGVLGTVLTTLCTIWVGLAQWLVLRRYATPSWGWVFVPAIAVLISSSLFGIKALLVLGKVPLPLDAGVLGAGVLGITQAIAFCALRKREPATAQQNSLLATAPEILNYGQVQLLSKRLKSQLNHEWKSEIASDRPLTYLIGVDEAGAIAAYEPVNSSANDRTNETPLPALVHSPASGATPGTTPALARFQVAFMPSGSLEILSWRGIPLLWMGLGMLVVLIGLSAIVGLLSAQLLHPLG